MGRWMTGFAAGCGGGDDSCAPPARAARTAVALVPFAAAFALVGALAVGRLFPALSPDDGRDGLGHVLPSHAPAALRHVHAQHAARARPRRLVAWTFGATLALAVVLALLIMAEIVDAVDPAARNFALGLAVPALLFLLVLLVPWLECRALVAAAGWSFHPSRTGSPPRVAWALQLVLFAAWLLLFWSVGRAVPAAPAGPAAPAARPRPLSEALTRACLERVGVVGISLMALLAGFASVSSPWHILHGAAARRGRRGPPTEADVHRKQAGLDAARDMLLTKRHQLRALEQRAPPRAAPAPAGRLVGAVLGSLRAVAGGGGGDEAEMRALRVEVAGLEAMEAGLASRLCLVRSDRAAAARAATPLGRLALVPSYVFGAYCLYRVAATALTTLRRASSPSAGFAAASDPVSRFLGLVARHWDPALDQAAWARTVGFALSGAVLAASANSAVQTLHLFARWAPGLLRHARAVLALAVGQVAATYVISASLLLRGQLPADAGGVLRGALSPAFVEGWFEGWFLLGAALTALGLALGRHLAAAAGPDDPWGDDGRAAADLGPKRL